MSEQVAPMTPPPDVTPGWYPAEGSLRYWDGERWTDQTAPMPVVPQPKQTSDLLVAIGWAGTFLFPLVGLVVGLVLTNRRHTAGVWILGISVASLVAWSWLIYPAGG